MSGSVFNTPTNISEEEFLRLQNQLIELRTANYSLEEQYVRQLSRNQQLQSQVEALEKECSRARSSVNGANRLMDSDLMAQNERLQLKLQTQENDFMLQNQTLLNELNALVQENGRLRGMLNQTSPNVISATELSKEGNSLWDGIEPREVFPGEEEMYCAQEMSKWKEIITETMEAIDKELQSELSEASEFNINAIIGITEESDVTSSGLIEERDSPRIDIPVESAGVQDDSSRENVNEMKLVSACRLAQLELAEAMQETERLKLEKEKESLGKNFEELKLKWENEEAISNKKIEDLEVSLQLLVGEQEKQIVVIEGLKSNNSAMEAHVEHLKSKLNECSMENEGMQEKLVGSMKSIEKLNEQLASFKEENQRLEKSLSDLEERLQGMVDELETLKVEKDFEESTMQQQLLDQEAEQVLKERKGAVLCRDLKRQLAAERRRVERLQERMREVLEGTHLKIGLESSAVAEADSTSISSWSLMSGNVEQQDSSTRESSSIAGSPSNMNGNVFPHPDDLDLEQESRNLLERVASLQEEKWTLEEKVDHLEQGNAAMAQDLMKKSKVIQFYCMDGRHEPLPSSSGKKAVKKFSDFLKNSEEEHLQECNARMQRMLEELLTKNMYLQRDMEQISKVVEKLQKVRKPEL